MNDTLEIRTDATYFDEHSPNLVLLIHLDQEDVKQVAQLSAEVQDEVKLSFDLLDVIKNEIVCSAVGNHMPDLSYSDQLIVDAQDKELFVRYRQKLEEAIALIDSIKYRTQ